jgi:hypothetical protein
MSDKLIEPFAALEVYCDGFTDFRVRNGNMTCVGFRLHEPLRKGEEPLRVVVLRLVFPKDCVPDAIAEAQAAFAAPVALAETVSGPRRKHH